MKLHSTKRVRHDRALDWLRGMTGPPAYDVTPQTALGENIPKRFALARSAGVRPCPAVDRVGLDEAVDAVLIGKFAGRDRVPEHRREDRLEGSKVTHHSTIDERIEGRHQTFLEQRGDVLPIGRVPSDQENFSLVSFFNHRETTRWKISA